MKKADIGVIGLGPMGGNIARNFERNGYTVALFNRTYDKTEAFIKQEQGKRFLPSQTLSEFAASLSEPRKVLLMVKAGEAVDELINKLLLLLEKGDIIIDGGNTYFKDTIARTVKVEKEGKLYVGMGISGGEDGALYGPSLMPGGSEKAWGIIRPIFEAIAAKTGEKKEQCCAWMGANGAGHFVKMVHNGIEYADMQLISESYMLMRDMLGMKPKDIQSVFSSWNSGPLQSYLIEITAHILSKQDSETGIHLIDVIADAAGQKGTGNWAAQSAIELKVPTPTIVEAVIARDMSSLQNERISAAGLFSFGHRPFIGDKTKMLKAIESALYASKIAAYAQGFVLMQMASVTYKWDLHMATIAGIWRDGCIIRARLLTDIMSAYSHKGSSLNLMCTPHFVGELSAHYKHWKMAVSAGIQAGLPIPGFTSALSYFEAYRNTSLPTNLIQAQRDYFGAHTYERIDKKGTFHTKW